MLQLEDQYRDGNASRFGISISAISVGSGDPIPIPTPGVTLVVGGNNAGKSTLLRQMYARLTDPWHASGTPDPAVLTNQKNHMTGRAADAFAWLSANAHLTDQGFSRDGQMLHKSIVEALWSPGAKGGLDQLGRMVALQPDARTRFAMTAPAMRRADIADPPAHPLHYLESEPELFTELDGYSNEIFGTGITLDPLSGNLFMRFGKVGMDAPPVDAVTPEYREALVGLGSLEKQGDGIGSTLGLLIPLVAGQHPIAFVDEPEAYLHPPQAYKLGQTIAAIAARHKSQIIVATHDRNFVAGVLSRSQTDTAVIRLERSGNTPTAHSIAPARLREVWSSAALRHSNVLDGLFHRAVVLAENERDCVFYAAALEAHGGLPASLLPSDVLYIASHGKHGMEEIAQILTAAHVPVVAAPDLDMLNDKVALKKLVEAVGGTWSDELEKDFDTATAEFRTPRKQSSRADVNAIISAVLSEDAQKVFDGETKRRINAALSVDSPWRRVKDFGMKAFRAEPRAAGRLVATLDTQGVALVRVGELEGFAPSLGVSKGKAWLRAALEENAFSNDDAKSYASILAAAVVEAEKRTAQ